MYRAPPAWRVCRVQSPHKPGDVPDAKTLLSRQAGISPQAWGCTDFLTGVSNSLANLPTSVGMYLTVSPSSGSTVQSPHKRGDVPQHRLETVRDRQISPQAWGCTVWRFGSETGGANLPTSVGMYRGGLSQDQVDGQSPHKRGDVPGNKRNTE